MAVIKYKDSNGITKSFLPAVAADGEFSATSRNGVQNRIVKAAIDGILNNKVTSISESSTDDKYPSAKAVYDLFASIVNGDEVSY